MANIGNRAAVSAAMARGRASTPLERVADGLDTLLGRGDGDGLDLRRPMAERGFHPRHDAQVAAEGGVAVFVTHRMSTERLADVIVVMSNGRVAEVGTHDELVAAAGRYSELWALPSAAYT